MKLEIQPNANDTITPHAIFAVNGPMIARTVTLAEAEFIVTACNEHAALKTDNAQLTMGLAAVRASLQTVQDNLDEIAKVQAQLVEAMRGARAILAQLRDDGQPVHLELAEIDAALDAAWVTP